MTHSIGCPFLGIPALAFSRGIEPQDTYVMFRGHYPHLVYNSEDRSVVGCLGNDPSWPTAHGLQPCPPP
jgi:hypothetical protein